MLKFKTKSDKAVPFPAEHVKRLIIKRVLSLASQNKDKINFEKVNLENVNFISSFMFFLKQNFSGYIIFQRENY